MDTIAHARDITDEDFVAAVSAAQSITGRATNRWEIALVLAGQTFTAEEDITDRAEESLPQKLVLAKARKVLKRGAITGCACGCRGDFEATAVKSKA